MFTKLVRISYIFLVCHSRFAKYQTYLTFHQPSTTPDLGYAHLVTILLCVSGLLDTLCALFYTVTLLSGSTCRPVVVK